MIAHGNNGNRREQCKTIAAFPHIKCTWSSEWQEFRVTLDGLSAEREEAVAYYTNDYEDAHDTAKDMSARRAAEISQSK